MRNLLLAFFFLNFFRANAQYIERIIFIGNSIIEANNTCKLFETLSTENGHTVKTCQSIAGGREVYTSLLTEINANNNTSIENGSKYWVLHNSHYREFKKTIRQYDVVLLQGRSLQDSFFSEIVNAAIRAKRKGTKVLVFENTINILWNDSLRLEKLEAYKKIFIKNFNHKALLLPVGGEFHQIYSRFGKMFNLLTSDNHPTALGSLTICTLTYYAIYNEFPILSDQLLKSAPSLAEEDIANMNTLIRFFQNK